MIKIQLQLPIKIKKKKKNRMKIEKSLKKNMENSKKTDSQ